MQGSVRFGDSITARTYPTAQQPSRKRGLHAVGQVSAAQAAYLQRVTNYEEIDRRAGAGLANAQDAERGPILALVALYVLAYCPMLINNGVFWDDWLIYKVHPESVMRMYVSNGGTPFGYFYNAVFSLPGSVLILRAIQFSTYLMAALLLYGVVRTIKEIDAESRFFIVALFALFPVNSARIALIDTPYALCNLLFFLGFWLTAKYTSSRNVLFRVAALPAFFLSFLTNSMLVFFVLVLAYVAYTERDRIASATDALKRAAAHAELVLLPILFWVSRLTFLAPSGLFGRYNKITPANLISTPLTLATAFFTSFLQAAGNAIGLLFGSTVLVLLVAFPLYVWLSRRNGPAPASENDTRFLLLGLAAFILAIFPYVVVDKIPAAYDWLSRHELLVPLGGSVLLYYGARLFLDRLKVRREMQLLAFAVIIASFALSNVATYASFEIDWLKQASLIQNLRASPEMTKATTFLFEDQTGDLDAADRTYRFYEYNGLMKYAFGTERRFGSDAGRFVNMRYYSRFAPNAQYNMRAYRSRQPQYLVTISHGSFRLTLTSVVQLLIARFSDPTLYKTCLHNIVRLTFTELPPKNTTASGG